MLSGLKKLFKKQKNVTSNDEYVKSKVIYNTSLKLMILVSFTEEYFYDAIEFCSACTNSGVKTKLAQSSYEEETTDKDGNKTIIYHPKYYLLVSSYPGHYGVIFGKIALSNNILKSIKDDLTNTISCTEIDICSNVFNYYILDKDEFKKDDIKYDDLITHINTQCDNIPYIMNQLPSSFSLADMIDVFEVYLEDGRIRTLREAYKYDQKAIIHFLRMLNNNLSTDTIQMLINSPVIAIDLDDDDINGYMSDEDIDTIFKQDYDKFVGITDEEIAYDELADEILTTEEEK